jgi:hypothetical protein
MRWAGKLALMGEMSNAENLKGKVYIAGLDENGRIILK